MPLKKLFHITVYETKHFQVNQDWEFPISGFFIITSKRKIKSMVDLTETEAQELMTIIRKIRVAMKSVLKIKEVCIFHDEKSKFNFHIWLLPHYSWVNPYSLSSTLRYAKKEMSNEKEIQNTKEAAYKVKEYLKK